MDEILKNLNPAGKAAVLGAAAGWILANFVLVIWLF